MKYGLYVSRLPAGESTWEWEVGPALLEKIGASYDIADLWVHIQVAVRKESRYLRLFFSLKGWVKVPCDRGLEIIELPIEAQHEQIYAWDSTYLPPEDTEEFFTLGPKEDYIDLSQSFYDYIGLAIPRKRVRPSCPDAACPAFVWQYLEAGPDEG
ncbi:MAG: DUF177 domain-containing protein [Bacteroidia bacterium]|jgi:uncharacterized metal-binding protein YceD (DUF177 family)|nr:DUF177 domain-containing protein [Bacteroidia bacterium]GIV23858.1 MAG: hypothetical protein KatS3mg025_1517 [Bacteroidia bacterium]